MTTVAGPECAVPRNNGFHPNHGHFPAARPSPGLQPVRRPLQRRNSTSEFGFKPCVPPGILNSIFIPCPVAIDFAAGAAPAAGSGNASLNVAPRHKQSYPESSATANQILNLCAPANGHFHRHGNLLGIAVRPSSLGGNQFVVSATRLTCGRRSRDCPRTRSLPWCKPGTVTCGWARITGWCGFGRRAVQNF